ncbi:MAG: PAS domain S-box protein [Balneolaceae bacterium]|nr:PAS domain S-box protein [Balneolaceae bacterium]
MGEHESQTSREEKRVRELLRYNILDTPDEKEFDDLTKVAAYLCDVKYAHIHFLDHDRQYSKSCHGWNVKEIPREESICHHTIQREKYMIVNDLSEDSRFKNLGYVEDKSIQFYVGIVLKSNGYNLGTLCVFGEESKQLTDQQLESLQILGHEVEAQLELRLKREELIDEHKKLKKSTIFLQNSTDVRLIVNPDTLNIEEVNEGADELLGYKPKQIQGTPLTDYLRGDEFETKLRKWAKNNATQKFSSETIIKTRQDDSLWFQINLTEESEKYYITGRNITQRKRSEQRFLRQEKLTENIIQHLPGIFFLIDKKGNIKKWNNNLIDVTNREPEETQNLSYTNFIAQKDHNKAQKALQKVFRDGYSRTELNFVSKDRKVTPILLVAFRYQVEDEMYATGIGIDISDKKQAIEELEQKEQKLKKAQRIGKMGSWTWYIPTNGLYWSDEVYKLYDLDKNKFEPTFENFMEMLSSSEQEKVDTIIQNIQKGKNKGEVEFEVQKPDGSIMYVHQRYNVHRDSKGNPVEVSGTMQDVTARRENEEKLKSALKEKEVLLAEVHHRVKNNLAIINSLLQLEIFNTENDMLKNILSKSQMRIHSMALVHETLYSLKNFANISFGKYIEKLITSLRKTFPHKSQQIDIDLHTEDVTLNINQAIPCALLINELITNSFKHAFPNSKSGTVAIKLQEKQNIVHLVVSDNGIGFNVDQALENPNTLGLTLVKKLILQIDGHVDIDTINGTSFHITFAKKQASGSSASYYPGKL